MKQILLLFSLLLFSCSASDEDEEVTVEPVATHFVFVMDACPEHDSIIRYGLNDAEFQKVNNAIKASNQYCVSIQFTDIKGEEVQGFYGGQD